MSRVQTRYDLRSLRAPESEDRSPTGIVKYVLSLVHCGDFPAELVYDNISVPDAAAICQFLHNDEDIENLCLRYVSPHVYKWF